MSEWRDPEGIAPPVLLAGCFLLVALIGMLGMGIAVWMSLSGG